METITKQQFDTLAVGDTLKDGHYTLLVEAKFANTIITIDDEHYTCTLSFKELQEQGYSLIPTIQHNCGFPYGDYSDKEVIVKVSDVSINHCEINQVYVRLMTVSKEGFKDHNGFQRNFVVLVTNNVDLVK